MEAINKFPRWALVSVCSVAILISWITVGYVIKNALADQEETKELATSAINKAEDAFTITGDLKLQLSEMRGAQETFRKEYREDQKDLDRKLGELLRAVKA